MNVFVLDDDHDKRAQYHCDTHVNKMLLETVQILNTALHRNDASDLAFYQKTHTNHPWCEWAAKSNANWQWLYEHALALHDEFQKRNGKTHKSAVTMQEQWESDCGISSVLSRLPNYVFTEQPYAMPDEYVTEDIVKSYRRYYANEKYPEDWCTWTTEVPDWILSRL